MRRHRRHTATFLAVGALILGACGDDAEADAAPESESTTTTTTAEASTTTTTIEADALPPGAEDLVGRWAHFDAVAYEDDVFKSLIISTGFADLELRDGVLWNRQRFCHAEMANDQGIDTSISDEATSAIIPVDTPVEVTLEDGRLRVVRPETPTPIGIDLEDPANEVLPTDPNDPRIIDSDGDGNPGVTARIHLNAEIEGDLYIARREIFHYDVTQESPDRMVGTITDSSEQLVIGASNEIFLTPAQWEQVPDPSRNPVIWQRVDETWDCERLAAERDDLFPPDPVVDW
jgi:hypothetical protein